MSLNLSAQQPPDPAAPPSRADLEAVARVLRLRLRAVEFSAALDAGTVRGNRQADEAAALRRVVAWMEAARG